MRKGRGRLFEAPMGEPGKPLNRNIAAHIRKLILEGTIDPGARLPAQRLLARDLRVSRNTILSVLQQLTSEGLIETRAGSGTYVAREPTPFGAPPPSRPRARAAISGAPLPLEVGSPAVDLFPMDIWNRVQSNRWRRMPKGALEEGDPAGWPGLRDLIAARVASIRDVRCDANQVLIVPSAQTAVELAARVLAAPGESAWVEDPGYFRARDAVRNAGLNALPAPIDECGFDVGRARKLGAARIAYVTPANQFPCGVVMSPARRRALLDWSHAENGWIVEDDFDAEFCFDGRPARPLAAEIRSERVVYVGTFNNLLFPALRVAYLVAPEGKVDEFVAARRASDRSMNTPLQVVLHDFMEQGFLAAHVRTCRAVYAERRQALLQALKTQLAGLGEVSAPAAGTQVQFWLGAGRCDQAIKQAAARRGVVVSAFSDHALTPVRPGLFLGFAPYPESQIRHAVDRIAASCERDRG